MPQGVERLGNNPPKNPCATGCGACPFAGGGCPLRSSIGTEGLGSKSIKWVSSTQAIIADSKKEPRNVTYILAKPIGGGGTVSSEASASSARCPNCKKDECDCPFSLKNRLN